MRTLLYSLLCIAFALPSVADERPNIVFILADDLGWSDLGCYGSDLFETPHLDQLAAEGRRYTQAYSAAPICSASRSSILTGKTPARLRFEFVTKSDTGFQPVNTPLRAPAYTLELPTAEKSIAEALPSYTTGFFGKWHVSRHYKRYIGWSPTHGPTAQGFDIAEEDFGSHPYAYWNQKKKRTFDPEIGNEIPTDSMTDRAINFLEREHEDPFFLFVSHFWVHTPVHTRVEMLHAHFLEKIPQDHPKRDELAHYGAMVTTLDHHVGRLLTALEKTGKAEDTLVVFTSDNGGHPDFAGNAPLRGSKWNLYEGGIRVPTIVRWPGEIEAGSVSDRPIIGTDFYATFADVAELESSAPDSVSIFSEKDPERALTWHFPYYHPETGYDDAPDAIGVNDGYTSKTKPHSAIRVGDWKLIRHYDDERDELYHLAEDIDESQNLVGDQTEVADRLSKRLDEMLIEMNARFPEPNPDFIQP